MTWSLLDRQTYAGLTRRRLQTLYLVAAAGLAALVPLILFAGFWIRSELGKSQRDVDLILQTRAASLSQRVDAEIEQQLTALRALSALPALDGDTQAFESAAGRVRGVMPHWEGLSLVEAASGRVLFTTAGAAAAEIPGADFVRRAAETRRPAVESRPETASGGGILINAPVVRNDAVALVLVTTFDARDIQEIVAAQGRETGLVTTLLDSRLRVLARSLAPETAIGRPAPARLAERVASRDSGIVATDWPDEEAGAGAFQRSRLTGWVAVASIARTQVERLTKRSVWTSIAAGALSLAVAGILAVFIIHTVMERRVSEERLAASRALGDLDARLLATSQEALGEQRKASSEREVLLREIYHRVKNNLQIVQSLLRLGSRELKPEQREPFESAVRRIGAMSRVHTLLYNSPDLASIDFKDYLEELLKELGEGFAAEERSIRSELRSEAMRMSLDTAVPLAFIAVEILTNSFKHAFPEGRSGRITVEVSRDDGTALLRIRDDGIGLAHDAVGKRRLGLTIVRKLVQQIGGTLEEPPPGASEFVVRFPVEGHGKTPGAPFAQPAVAST